MGLDQCFQATIEPLTGDNYNNASPFDPERDWIWRKHYPLWEFMYHNADMLDCDDGGPVGTHAVTAEVLDALEAALTSEAGLPMTWHNQYNPERSVGDRAYDLRAVQWARERLAEGKCVYHRYSL